MSIDELKSLQLKVIKKNRICNIVATLVFLILLMVTLKNIINFDLGFESGSSFFSIFPIFPVILIEFIFFYMILEVVKASLFGKDMQLFHQEFKNVFVLTALKKIFAQLEYQPNYGIEENVVRNTGMMDTGDRFSSNDYIKGMYKDIVFEQSDIHITERHEEKDEDGNTKVQYVTVFMGRWMIFDFNKSFRANIKVESKLFGGFSLGYGNKYSKVQMEDAEFNQIFSVYAEDEHDAFYVLTPHFMEKMKKIENELNCGMMFGFVDHKLHIAIDNREDSFECNIFKVIDEKVLEDKIIKDIKLITDFVDELDNNLFKKEA